MVDNDTGAQANVFELDDESLAVRQVFDIDLLHTPNAQMQPLLAQLPIPECFSYISTPGWYKTRVPASCIYTLLDIKIGGFVPTKVEKTIATDMVERMQLSKVRSISWYESWRKLSIFDALELDREFEKRAHQEQGFPPPLRKPLSECLTPQQSGPASATGASSKVPYVPAVPIELLGAHHPYVNEKRRIRKHVKEWHKRFVAANGREPTDGEYADALAPMFKRAKQLDRLIQAALHQAAS